MKIKENIENSFRTFPNFVPCISRDVDNTTLGQYIRSSNKGRGIRVGKHINTGEENGRKFLSIFYYTRIIWCPLMTLPTRLAVPGVSHWLAVWREKKLTISLNVNFTPRKTHEKISKENLKRKRKTWKKNRHNEQLTQTATVKGSREGRENVRFSISRISERRKSETTSVAMDEPIVERIER